MSNNYSTALNGGSLHLQHVNSGYRQPSHQQAQYSNISAAEANAPYPVQCANAYAFNANTQRSLANGHLTPPSTIPSFEQPHHNPFPPSPFSARPSFPNGLSAQPQPKYTQNTLHPLPSKPSTTSALITDHGSDGGKHLVTDGREDGELGDGGMNKQVKHRLPSVPGAILQQPGQLSTMPHAYYPLSTDHTYLTSAHNGNGHPRSDSSIDHSDQPSRARARTALQDLFSLDIDFTKLVEEGLNPKILRGLSAEIGVQIASQPVQDSILNGVREEHNMSSPVHPDKTTSPDPVTEMSQPTLQSDDREILPTQPTNINTVTEKAVCTSTPRTQLDQSSTPKESEIQVLRRSIPDPPSRANLGVVKSSSFSVLSKSLAPKSGEKSVDRKEYIARMLAAKNSKLVPSAPPTMPFSNSEALTTTAVARQSPAFTDVGVNIISEGLTSHKQDTSKILPQSVTGILGKKKAQTDLARQRMEALMRSSSSTLPLGRAPSGNNPFGIDQSQAGVLPEALVLPGISTSLQSQHPPANRSFQISQSSQPVSRSPLLGMTQVPTCAPISRVPSFASPIPGLFMGYSQPLPPEASNGSSAQPTEPISHPVPQPSVRQSLPSYPQVNSSGPAQSTTIQPTGNAEVLADGHPSKDSRKRHKAADFLDSPPVRVKRPLGQSEDTQVIIEISEDEDADLSDDAPDDTNGYSSQVSTDIRSESMNASNLRGTRDIHLTNFPNHKKSLTKSTFGTLPSARTPMTVNGRDLETEIQNLHQKIAEAERRKNIGPVISNSQTPRTPGLSVSATGREGTPSSMTGISNEFNQLLEQPKRVAAGAPLANSSLGEPRLQKNNAVEISKAGRATQTVSNGLSTLNQLEPDNPANMLIRAEVSDPAKHQAASNEQRNQKGELAALEVELARVAKMASEERVSEQQKRAGKQALIEAEHTKAVENARQEQELAEKRMQEERLAQIEAERVKAAEAARKEQLLAEQQQHETALARIEAERKTALETAKIAEREQHVRRKLEIESGLPILDAEVERTKQRLHKLRNEIEILENEVLKGVEGRKILTDELDQIAHTLSDAEHDEHGATESTTDISMMNDLVQSGAHDSQSATAALQDANRPLSPEPTEVLRSTPPPTSLTKETSPTDKLAEDMMDISDSDEDDGEIMDDTENSFTKKAATPVPDEDEEMYEPPTTFEYHPQPRDLVDEEPSQAPIAVTDSNQGETQQPHPANQDVPILNATPAVSLSPTVPDAIISAKHLSSPMHVDVDKSDSDYEPPEPAIPVDFADSLTSDLTNQEKTPLVTLETVQNTFNVLQATEENTSSKVDQSVPEEATKGSKKPEKSFFKPYQSALKQFKSFRNYPDLVSEVPGGFRSLTYSHKIDPHMPICQYEAAGGRCNDTSCDSQHFRNMGLSDDLILVQLGSQPEGLDAAQNATYVTGLKQVIQDMREKKIKDFNVVSSKITAYRSKFLGDSSRILPL